MATLATCTYYGSTYYAGLWLRHYTRSVFNEIGNMGGNGHKNRLGQAKVADFLEPQIRRIMGW